MATSNYSIYSINTIDISVPVELLYSLKSTLAFNRAVFKNWPNEATQKALYRATIENILTPTSATESLKAVNDETGDIIGYVAVSRESPSTQNPAEQQKQHSDAEATGFDADQVYAAAIKAPSELQRGVETCDHFEITYVGVKPSCRNRGIGAKLVYECFNRAKKAGISLTLNAELEAVEFYLKLGFEETVYADIDLSQWMPPSSGFGHFRWTGMIWYP